MRRAYHKGYSSVKVIISQKNERKRKDFLTTTESYDSLTSNSTKGETMKKLIQLYYQGTFCGYGDPEYRWFFEWQGYTIR